MKMKIPELRLEKVCASPEGRLSDQARGTILAHLRRYPGVPLDVLIRQHKSKRSNAQNARHWALMTVGAKSLWEDPGDKETLHDELAHLYFGLPPCPKTGLRRRRRTPNTDTKEFCDFTDYCAMKLTELGADLTDWDTEAERIAAA